MQFTVTYTNHGGVRKVAIVTVCATTDVDGATAYFAKNLSVFGCGKNASTPVNAVHRLVQDHGQVLGVRPLPEAQQ